LVAVGVRANFPLPKRWATFGRKQKGGNMSCEACGKRIRGKVRLDSEGYEFHEKCFKEAFSEELKKQKAAPRTPYNYGYPEERLLLLLLLLRRRRPEADLCVGSPAHG
jgi:hypothetical protein